MAPVARVEVVARLKSNENTKNTFLCKTEFVFQLVAIRLHLALDYCARFRYITVEFRLQGHSTALCIVCARFQ